MNCVVLATDRSIDFREIFDRVKRLLPNAYLNSDRIVDEGVNDNLFIDVYNDATREMEPEELGTIERLIPSASMYLISYHSMDRVKGLLLELADDPMMVVDNDAGTTLPGPDFVARLRAEPQWDLFEESRRMRGWK